MQSILENHDLWEIILVPFGGGRIQTVPSCVSLVMGVIQATDPMLMDASQVYESIVQLPLLKTIIGSITRRMDRKVVGEFWTLEEENIVLEPRTLQPQIQVTEAAPSLISVRNLYEDDGFAHAKAAAERKMMRLL